MHHRRYMRLVLKALLTAVGAVIAAAPLLEVAPPVTAWTVGVVGSGIAVHLFLGKR